MGSIKVYIKGKSLYGNYPIRQYLSLRDILGSCQATRPCPGFPIRKLLKYYSSSYLSFSVGKFLAHILLLHARFIQRFHCQNSTFYRAKYQIQLEKLTALTSGYKAWPWQPRLPKVLHRKAFLACSSGNLNSRTIMVLYGVDWNLEEVGWCGLNQKLLQAVLCLVPEQ